jgi:hypothetical protein
MCLEYIGNVKVTRHWLLNITDTTEKADIYVKIG